MAKVRVLVVEDSSTIRQRFCEVLASDPDIEVIGNAADGKQAIELCRELRPDAVSLDMMLPIMSGLAATEYIMAHCPTPILIVSSSSNRGEFFTTYEALAAGALDVLDKPQGDEADGAWERKYTSAIKLIARIKVITHPRARLGALGRSAPMIPPAPSPATERDYRIAALGASTGGPAALVEVLRAIPAALPIPTLIVLHIHELFGLTFAEWLGAQTPHRVGYAREGDTVNSAIGHVVMAPPGKHLVVRGGRLHLTNAPERHSCRPSVDVLFESIAHEYGAAAIAALLTGMGKDGAAGLLEIRRAGGLTIAQDEATSIVYGMPHEAVLLGAAERVLPLAAIGQTIATLSQPSGGT